VIEMTESRRRQRKLLFNLHVSARRRKMVVPLAPELQAQKGIKRLPVRKGDTVIVVRGESDIRGIEGKVSKVNTRTRSVVVEGVTVKKADGKQTERPVYFGNVMITAMTQDKMRKGGAQ